VRSRRTARQALSHILHRMAHMLRRRSSSVRSAPLGRAADLLETRRGEARRGEREREREEGGQGRGGEEGTPAARRGDEEEARLIHHTHETHRECVALRSSTRARSGERQPLRVLLFAPPGRRKGRHGAGEHVTHPAHRGRDGREDCHGSCVSVCFVWCVRCVLCGVWVCPLFA
jgi:hypothetical protein